MRYKNYACTGLTSIEIPNSVEYIGEGAFKGCKRLTSIEIPNSVTSIEWDAFSGCTGLTSIEIPNSVKITAPHLRYYSSDKVDVFKGCCNLKKVYFSQHIEEKVFKALIEDANLSEVHIKAEDPNTQEVEFNEEDVKNITLYVPIGTGYAYRRHPEFRKFKEVKIE